MTYGWVGKILRVDLTKGRTYEEPTMKYAKRFIGGTGIASAILYNETPPEVKPLDPENLIVFNTGPLSGTFSPSCGRWSTTCKSPVTESYSDSNGGGFFGAHLKWAGYDHIVVHGRSEKPVYLWIDDGEVEIRDASYLWGKSTWETHDIIIEELDDPEVKTVKIGPAGEHVCLGACVIGDYARAAGRGGNGAVMGSKKLKAIAVRGTMGVEIADPDKFEAACEEMYEKVRRVKVYDQFSNLGTPWLVYDGMFRGNLIYPGYGLEEEKVMGWKYEEELLSDKFKPYFAKSKGCFNCPMHCGHIYRVKEGPYAGIMGEGVEANSIMDFGPTVDCHDVSFVLKCTELCNKLGLGVDEAASTYAFAVELYKRGIITLKDTDGMEFRYGDQEAVLEHIRKMSYREGFGNVLADLLVRGGERIGKGAEKLALAIKKLPSVPSDLKLTYGFALSYALSTRGADHLKGTPTVYETWLPAFYPLEYVRKVGEEKFGNPEACITPLEITGKAAMVAEAEHMCYAADFAIICKFVTRKIIYEAINIADIAKMLTPCTGVEYTEEDLVRTAQRINAIQRAFNCREGFRRGDDYPMPVSFQGFAVFPRKGGAKFVLERKKYDRMLDEYYKIRGVDLKTGIPTRQKLEEMDLKEVADDLTKRGILKE